jgi:uncharacterized protein YcnI
MRLRACALAAVGLLAMPATAAAHVELSPDRVSPGSFTLFTVLSPNESRSPLTGLRLTVPDGMDVDAAADTPGFATATVTDQSHRTIAIVWSGGRVAPEHLALFRFSASVRNAPGTVQMTAVQTFADGTTRTWTTPQVEVDDPTQSSDGLARGLAAGAFVAAAAAATGAALAWRKR